MICRELRQLILGMVISEPSCVLLELILFQTPFSIFIQSHLNDLQSQPVNFGLFVSYDARLS